MTAAAVVGTVASNLMSSALQNQAAGSTSDKANAFNERMMDKQNLFNTRMWNAANMYNSPAAQAERLRAAGLNPKLAMVNPNLAGEVSSAPAQPYQAPAYTAPDPFGAAVQGLQIGESLTAQDKQNQILGVQADYMETKTIQELTESKARVDKYLSSEKLDYDTARYYRQMSEELQEKIDYAWETHDIRVQNERQGLVNARAAEEESKARRDQTYWNIKYGQAKLQIEQRLADSKIKVDKATVNQLSALAANLQAQTQDINERLQMDKTYFDKVKLPSGVEEALRLKETTADYIEQAHNAMLISNEEYELAKKRVEEIQTIIERNKSELNNYDILHGNDAGNPWSVILGIVNNLTESVGGIFAGSGAASIAKFAK